MSLFTSMPIYVTREDADGFIGAFSMSIWMPLLAMLLVWANAIVWGVVGLIYAVRVVV